MAEDRTSAEAAFPKAPIQCQLVAFNTRSSSSVHVSEVTVSSDSPNLEAEPSLDQSITHITNRDEDTGEHCRSKTIPKQPFRPELRTFPRSFIRQRGDDEEEEEDPDRAKNAESLAITHALFACSYGANVLFRGDKQLYELDLIPRVINSDSASTTPKYDYTLLQMESSLLNLAAGYQQTVGIFYFLAYESGYGRVFVRYFEAGNFRGIVRSKVEEYLVEKMGRPKEDFIFVPVYTRQDIDLRVLKNDSISRAVTGRGKPAFIRKTSMIGKLLNWMGSVLSDKYWAVFTQTRRTPRESEPHRNLWISPLMQPDKETWIQKAEDFFVHGRSQVLGPETLIRHLKDSRISELATFRSQVELLTSIPNFHWWNQVRQDGSEIRSEPQVNYSQHLLFHPDMDAEDPARRYRYKPCSPRHQIMDFLSNNNLHLRKVVKHMLSIDRGEGKSAIPLHRPLPSQGLASDAQVASNPTADHMDYSEEIPVPPPRKRRKHGPRIKSLSAQAYCQQMDIAYEQVITPNDQEIRSQYKSFVEDVLSAGRIQKRFEQHGVQVYLINDYSVTTGVMAPNKYVHLTAMEQDGQTLIKCTCQAYEQLQGTSNAGYGQTLRESAWLDSQLTCMHARLFREECLDLNEGSNFAAKITPIPDEPDDVHLIDQPYLHSATKFSVAGERYGFVHVWFENGQCMVQCQDQYCHATLLKKKKQKLKKKKDGKDAQKEDRNCEHLARFFMQWEKIEPLFSQFFESNEEHENLPSAHFPSQYPDNEEDAHILSPDETNEFVYFDPVQSQWQSKAFTQNRKPLQQEDPKLIKATMQRLQHIGRHIESSSPLDEKGRYEGPDLLPELAEENGETRKCQCGADGWLLPRKYSNVSVYSRNGVLNCQLFVAQCTSQSCFAFGGEKEGIFFLSDKTGAGDELAWDFVDAVRKGRVSFSGFCTLKTKDYRTTHSASGPFMNPKTFVKWVLSWMSSLGIDYRKDMIDPECKHDPPMLACDGTHIGVSNKLSKLTPATAVGEPDLQRKVKPRHKRYNRVLMAEPLEAKNKVKERIHLARDFVPYWCRKLLGMPKDPDPKKRTTFDDIPAKRCLIECMKMVHGEKVLGLMQRFVDLTEGSELSHVDTQIVKFIFMICGDPPLSAFIPYRYNRPFLDVLNDLREGDTSSLHTVNDYCSDLHKLLSVCLEEPEVMPLLCDFLQGLVQAIQSCHRDDSETGESVEIPGSYNPSIGAAYYFTPHGNQIRQTPCYDIPGSNSNNDDLPRVDSECKKSFPKISKAGFGHMMFMFCPIHGHVYGFHLIYGSEGRKDVFGAIYKYKPTAPDELFYDFACNLSEYCLNREPKFFCCTRFWHDLFHGITHKCGKGFKSQRVAALRGVNSEICEQFNSYLQCIKYTGSHLSQTNLMLFTQFMGYLWNKGKTERCQKVHQVLLGGML